jgi:hypothetical protein
VAMCHSNRIKTDVETTRPHLRRAGDVRVAYRRQNGGLYRPTSCSALLYPMGTLARQAPGDHTDISHDLLSTRSRTGVRSWTEQIRRQRPSAVDLHTAASSETSTKATENHGGT